jgi:hypothetical protein
MLPVSLAIMFVPSWLLCALTVVKEAVYDMRTLCVPTRVDLWHNVGLVFCKLSCYIDEGRQINSMYQIQLVLNLMPSAQRSSFFIPKLWSPC